MKGEHAVASGRANGSRALSNSRKSAKKRDAILRAAIEIINAKSFALATMSEIAATLDLRDAALYYYFPSKQALAFACHLRSLQRFDAMLITVDKNGGSGAARLEHVLQQLLFDAAENGPWLYLGDLSYLTDAQRDEISVWALRLIGVLERYLSEGIVDGSIVPCEPKIVVQMLLGMLIWLAKWVPSIKDVTPERLMAAMGMLSLDGLRPR